jgi:hypothetical protein
MPQIIDVPNLGQVEFPDDMSDDQIVAAIKKNTMSTTDRVVGGAKHALQKAGFGIKEALDVPAQYLESKFGTTALGKLGASLGMPTAADSAEQTPKDIAALEERDAPVLETTAGKVGDFGGTVAAFLPTMIAKRAVLPVTAASAALMTPGSVTDRLTAGGLAAAGSAAGKYAGQEIGKAVNYRAANKAAKIDAKIAQNQTRDATLVAGQQLGLVVPPAQARPTLVNKALEGFAGKASTAQGASIKNTPMADNIGRRALGLPEDAPLSKETFDAVRTAGGEAYEAVRNVGTIKTGPQYTKDLSAITKKYEGASKDFPELANDEISKIVASVNKQQFSSSAAVDAISILRDRASTAYGKGDRTLGKAYRETSKALEDAIDRHLEKSGKPAAKLLKDYRAGRELIAKSYSVEGAVNKGSGHVDLSKLGAQLNRGKPLSGELKTAAKFAQAFPKATQEVTSSMPGTSPLDWMGAAATSLLMGHPAPMAGVAARPVARSVLLSKPYQRLMTPPKYSSGLMPNLFPATMNNPATQGAFRLLPSAGAFSYPIEE